MTKEQAVERLVELLQAREEIGGDVATLAKQVGLTRQRLYQLAATELENRKNPGRSTLQTSNRSLTDDLRIRDILELSPPSHLLREFAMTPTAEGTVIAGRTAANQILRGKDDRLLVICGPCSIHDFEAALEYATRLQEAQLRFDSELSLIMRVYFEKPRTTIGWKGFINDPFLDGSYRINDGLKLARKLLLQINEIGIPAGTEYLDMITPQYFADLVSWGAIGARTTESQVHRELASGLSCPVGFKNGSDGNTRIAVDAIKAAAVPHHFLSVTKGGISAIVATSGNEDCHLILRGGLEPNYGPEHIERASNELSKSGLAPRLMVDLSHANSLKKAERQLVVGEEVAEQIAAGDSRIMGVMIESHLNAGRQDLQKGSELHYGVSVTDGCIGWDATVGLLEVLAAAVRGRRRAQLDVN
jgi:3-deoxy-7-phosphoheptulonate synthase